MSAATKRHFDVRTEFSSSIETRQLAERLLAVPVDETVSYQDLTAIIDRDIQGEARHSLHSARKVLLRDHQIVFAVVRNIGLKRLDDLGKIATADASLRAVRRAARRGIARITAVEDFDALPAEMKLRHNAAASVLGAVSAMSKPSSVKKIEAAVNTAQTGALPLGKTLEAFRRPSEVKP